VSRSLAELRHLCDQYTQVARPNNHEIDAMSDRQNQTVRPTFQPASGTR
jgi:hypothetical protein